ncbi:MAG: methyltransferase [Acidimicrobiaceae bacterium]|nr:methyltransferase [Acidimicrobiaceae bacterium]
MRIIAGVARGRPLRAKLPEGVRPTTDYAREAIFSMLESRGGLRDLVVVDLFSGSGAMGLEAFSRGAREVYFVDSDPTCLAAARTNYESLGLSGRAHFVRATLPAWRLPDGVDLVVMDPPYGPVDVGAILGESRITRVVVENDRFVEAPGYDVVKQKRYGTTLVTMLEPTTEDVS